MRGELYQYKSGKFTLGELCKLAAKKQKKDKVNPSTMHKWLNYYQIPVTDAVEKGYIEMAWCACGCGNRFKPQLGKKYFELACKRKVEIKRQKERREKKVKKIADPNRQNKGFWGNMPIRTAAQQQAALDAIPGPTALERRYCRGPENEMDTKI